jgi:predicted ATP-dependent endonuclease of OLD family
MSLTVLMSMHAEDFIEIDQRSDGLRQFVALRSFVMVEGSHPKPVVLIDEAETHLHYDAQADLVRVLEEQEETAKVIYTTHSAGCLPRDLGTGIRAVVPVRTEVDGRIVQTDDSATIDRFWTQGQGFSPVLIAMGASAFAFSAARKAVVTEGMSDVLLLPTLIRAATDAPYLDYQVAPSFASATTDEVKDLDLVAGRVIYLADGDDGGQAHAEKLARAGITGDQITFLGGEGSGLSTEDLLVKDVYIRAVNDELSRWQGLVMPAEVVGDTGRSAAVEAWCALQPGGDDQPVKISKVDVAQRVLDQRLEVPNLLAPNRRVLLRALDAELQGMLSRAGPEQPD